jgi:hypothetical protein
LWWAENAFSLLRAFDLCVSTKLKCCSPTRRARLPKTGNTAAGWAPVSKQGGSSASEVEGAGAGVFSLPKEFADRMLEVTLGSLFTNDTIPAIEHNPHETHVGR